MGEVNDLFKKLGTEKKKGNQNDHHRSNSKQRGPQIFQDDPLEFGHIEFFDKPVMKGA
jgi:hypothetical protein